MVQLYEHESRAIEELKTSFIAAQNVRSLSSSLSSASSSVSSSSVSSATMAPSDTGAAVAAATTTTTANSHSSEHDAPSGVDESRALVATIDNSFHMLTTANFICIIKDMTDASRGCRPHYINLSSTYTVENLIQQAAKFFSYAADSFALVWKNDESPIVGRLTAVCFLFLINHN